MAMYSTTGVTMFSTTAEPVVAMYSTTAVPFVLPSSTTQAPPLPGIDAEYSNSPVAGVSPLDRVRRALADGFESWAAIVVHRPWQVLLTSAFFAFALAAGMLSIEMTGDATVLWSVRTRGYESFQYMSTCCGEEGASLLMYCERVGAGSIFDSESLLELHKIRNWTTSQLVSTTSAGNTISFDDVCAKADGNTCDAFESSATLSGAFASEAALLGISPWHVAGVLSVDNKEAQFAIKQIAAPTTLDSNGDVSSSRAVMLQFSLRDDPDGNNVRFQNTWNDKVSAVADPSIIRVTYYSEAGEDSETARTVSGDIPLFSIATCMVAFFLSVTLGRVKQWRGVPLPDLVRGRFTLGLMSVTVVLLATGAGFGVSALFGATFHSFVSLVPLIALGVQVDDCIITVNTLAVNTLANAAGSLEERFGKSIRESGPCITTTSLTTVVCFAIGISSNLPGVSFFCMYATAVFFFGWLLQVTFFYACLVIDEKRIARSADCVTCCFTVTSNVDVEKQDPSSFKTDTAVQRAFGRYADVLLKPVVSLAVVLLFFGVASVASGLVSNISIGLPLEDILPDDSSVRDAFATEKEIFKGRATSVTSVVQGEDFNQLEARQRFRNAIGGVGQVENAVVELPNWMDAYEAWQGGSDTGSYLKGMQTFLGSKQGARWKSHVTCPDITCTSIATAKFDVLFMLSRPGTTQMDELQTRDNIDDVLNPIYPAGNVVVHSPPFMFAETDLAIWRAVLETIGFSLIGVFCVVCLSTSMSTAALITLTVAMIDVDLLLFAYALGLRLNSVSYTCLVMACGLAVDYCVHLGHAFDHSKKDGKDGALSNKAAARHAVAQMGASIFQGGMTTLLGVIVLAGASSVIFRTFFFFVFATVLLGVAHGLVLLPILLTYLTPTCGKAS